MHKLCHKLLSGNCYCFLHSCVTVVFNCRQQISVSDVIDNNTLLHIACRHGYFEIVKYLLGRGADPNVWWVTSFKSFYLHKWLSYTVQLKVCHYHVQLPMAMNRLLYIYWTVVHLWLRNVLSMLANFVLCCVLFPFAVLTSTVSSNSWTWKGYTDSVRKRWNWC